MAAPLQGSILITGASGQLGGELVRLFTPGETSSHAPVCAPVHAPLYAPTREELDLGSPASIRAYVRALRPRWILNAGAYTAVDRAESDRAAAFAVNAEAPRILGEEAAAIDAAVLHFSTDYVFTGSGTAPFVEADPTGPLGVYGASKLAGEQALAASGAAHLIFRTSWVYGATGKNFLLTVLRIAREREQMSIVEDQHGAPTWARDLARMTAAILPQLGDTAGSRAMQGIYHAAGQGETTWFGFAREALRLRREAHPGEKLADLVPIPTSAYPTPAARPANSRLNCRKLETTFGYRMLPWQEALNAVIGEIP